VSVPVLYTGYNKFKIRPNSSKILRGIHISQMFFAVVMYQLEEKTKQNAA